MEKKILFYNSIAIFTVLMSCSEDFLSVPVYVNENADTYFINDANASASLIAVYHVLRAEETYGVPVWLFGDVPSDDTEAGGESDHQDQPDMQDFDRMYYKSSNPRLLDFWNGMYIGIFRANWVIQNIKDNNYISPATRQQLIGEARFLRAMMHFDLMKVFGGITIRDENSLFEVNPVRSSISEVLHFVQNQLIISADELSQVADQDGRATSGAAKALLVKVFVFESSYADLRSEGKDPDNLFNGCLNKWNEARDEAEEIITNKEYYGYDLDSNFSFLWTIAGENSPEHIFKIKATRISGHAYPYINMGMEDEWGSLGGSGTVIASWQGCRGNYVRNEDDELVLLDTYNRGYGFNCPTPELVNNFHPDDPRLRASVVFDFIDSTTRNINGVVKYVRLGTNASPTGYCSKKYLLSEEEWTPANIDHNSGAADIKLIRYADLLLWAAEAHLKATNNSAKALEYTNLIRKRARESVFPASIEPVDLTSITLEDIYNERRLELALEGHRFFDLVRSGRAYDYINGQYNGSIRDYLHFEQRKHEFFPLPSNEISLSNNSITQNPGY